MSKSAPLSVNPIESHERLGDSAFTLQTPVEFRDDFVQLANMAGESDLIAFETMQFEVCAATDPIFNAIKAAKERGVKDVRFHYDRVAREHVRDPEDGAQAWFRPDTLGGLAIYSSSGNRDRLKHAFKSREQLISDLEAEGIANPVYKKRGEQKRLSHNHAKLAIIGGTAWFGTMNQRSIDYEMTNFMIKVTDPTVVAALKYVFEQTEANELGQDKILLGLEDDTTDATQLLLDVGKKGQSAIYERAVNMADSLRPGDHLTMIGQWPPVKSMYGLLAKKLQAKMAEGSKATFLLSPEEFLHPSKLGAKVAKHRTDSMAERNPTMTAIYLPEQTHAKAILIERMNGETEVLIGSHNFTSWTVANGTRELAMWTKNSEITDQVKSFLELVQKVK